MLEQCPFCGCSTDAGSCPGCGAASPHGQAEAQEERDRLNDQRLLESHIAEEQRREDEAAALDSEDGNA